MKLISQKYYPEEMEHIISEILAGAKVKICFMNNQYGYLVPLTLGQLNAIFRVRPEDDQYTLGQTINWKDLFVDTMEADKLLPEMEKTKAAIARRKTKNYSTRLLDRLHLTIEKHWMNFDPNNAPKSEVILKELQEEYGLSNNEAIAIDLIARHESVREKKDKSQKKSSTQKIPEEI